MALSARQMVDEYMNCEDIALNFLIAHITRKPPIKTTTRSSFTCAKCKGLSNRAQHYHQRDDCINRLISIYGYNPLMKTNIRSEGL
ncbi:hypothetical protein P879_09729 [Paragonimus westermani]|uniref:Glycosyl transferase 64 domain-containing protein n=1 Tax=Paragonimus westermani TaxID=34504 RepID=A0A8T0DH58_9TREM|nr:hypothetical protein P879_09729 [Paragonimus westermani]